MKTVRNKILSGMMALVLVVSLLATTTVDAYAATEYVDTFMKTYTLRKKTTYKIPLEIKRNANLKITLTIVDGKAGEQMYVAPWLWGEYDDEYTLSGSNETLGLGSDMVSKVSFKGKALKGDKSAITIAVGHGGDVKVKVKITCSKNLFCPKGIEVVSRLYET